MRFADQSTEGTDSKGGSIIKLDIAGWDYIDWVNVDEHIGLHILRELKDKPHFRQEIE